MVIFRATLNNKQRLEEAYGQTSPALLPMAALPPPPATLPAPSVELPWAPRRGPDKRVLIKKKPTGRGQASKLRLPTRRRGSHDSSSSD